METLWVSHIAGKADKEWIKKGVSLTIVLRDSSAALTSGSSQDAVVSVQRIWSSYSNFVGSVCPPVILIKISGVYYLLSYVHP